METWGTTTNATIDNKLKGIKEKEIRFYRVEELKRNISRIDQYAKTCHICQKLKPDVTAIADKLDQAIHVPGQTRRNYDRIISRIASHMQKEHGFFTPYYFTYLFSFFGMTGGLLLGYMLHIIFPSHNWEMLLLGFTIGLIAGYIPGFIKDRRIREQKRLM